MIRRQIHELAKAGHPTYVLMQSYGGIVGSEAALQEHTLAARGKAGGTGGIVRLVFMSAFILLPGENVVEEMGTASDTDAKNAQDANTKNMDAEYYDDGTCKLLSAAKTSFTLLPGEEAEYWASRLPIFPVTAGMAPASRASWKDIPTTYVYGRKDNSILLPIQERMVRRANDEIGICHLVQEHLDTDHSPQLSGPDEIIGVLERAHAAHLES